MTADSHAFQLQIDSDARLAAAAGGAARFVGEAAGLSSEASIELQKSVVTVCIQAFSGLSDEHSHLTVIVGRFPDRIEVAVAHQGDPSPAVGLDQIAGFAGGLGGGIKLSGVDRIQYEARQGQAVTRLIKYLGNAPLAA